MDKDDEAINKILRLANSIYEYDKRVHVVNFSKLEIFNHMLELCKLEFYETCDVTSQLFEPFKDDGFITITSKEIDFSGKSFFSNVIGVCDNIDIYSKDGNVVVDVSFSGLTEAID